MQQAHSLLALFLCRNSLASETAHRSWFQVSLLLEVAVEQGRTLAALVAAVVFLLLQLTWSGATQSL
tara:strand:+ start:349 stop:549 length:201 start_codon:yes stop_codon:yes gene_type:complete